MRNKCLSFDVEVTGVRTFTPEAFHCRRCFRATTVSCLQSDVCVWRQALRTCVSMFKSDVCIWRHVLRTWVSRCKYLFSVFIKRFWIWYMSSACGSWLYLMTSSADIKGYSNSEIYFFCKIHFLCTCVFCLKLWPSFLLKWQYALLRSLLSCGVEFRLFLTVLKNERQIAHGY